MKIEFVDHLPTEVDHRPKRSQIDCFALALRDSPGRWGKWPNRINELTARSHAQSIRGGRHSSFPADEYEARVYDGELYVRFVIEEPADSREDDGHDRWIDQQSGVV